MTSDYICFLEEPKKDYFAVGRPRNRIDLEQYLALLRRQLSKDETRVRS